MKTLIAALVVSVSACGVETEPTLDAGLDKVVVKQAPSCPCSDVGVDGHLLHDPTNALVICAPLCNGAGTPFSPNTPFCYALGLPVDTEATDCRWETPVELGFGPNGEGQPCLERNGCAP